MTFFCTNLFSQDSVTGIDCVVEGIVDNLLGMVQFLQVNEDSYNGIYADFSIYLPEESSAEDYTDFNAMLSKATHKKLVEFYNMYCPNAFKYAECEGEGSDRQVMYSFFIEPTSTKFNESEIFDYYEENNLTFEE